MAKQIEAIGAYRPRIERGKTIKTDNLADFIADHTGLGKSEVVFVLLELHEAIVWYNRMGHGVKLEGIGTYLPNIHLDGTVDVEHRLDRRLKRRLNEEGLAVIINEQNVGKTVAELVALWNEEHPEDPV